MDAAWQEGVARQPPTEPLPIHALLAWQQEQHRLTRELGWVVPATRGTLDQRGISEAEGIAVPCAHFLVAGMNPEVRAEVTAWAAEQCRGAHVTLNGYWWFFAEQVDAIHFWLRWG